jgi:hypothetical protein
MPDMSSVITFVTALKTRKTNSTKALDVLFANDPTNGAGHPQLANPNFAKLDVANALSSGPGGSLPSWAKLELLAAGLSHPEVNHVGQWPANQREDVRQVLVAFIQENSALEFFWDLTNGTSEETDISGNVITFLSPKSNVHFLGPNNISVDVGGD